MIVDIDVKKATRFCVNIVNNLDFQLFDICFKSLQNSWDCFLASLNAIRP